MLTVVPQADTISHEALSQMMRAEKRLMVTREMNSWQGRADLF